jgi:hypothetical protein
VEPSRTPPADDPDAESVGEATGLAGASVGAGLGPIGSGEEVGTADDDAGADAANSTSSCVAPADPPVVDEHPAIAAVASTSPTVSVLKGVLIASLDPWVQGCDSPRMAVRRMAL